VSSTRPAEAALPAPPAGEDDPLPATETRPATGRRGGSPRTRVRLAVVGVVLVAALVFLLVEGLGSSLNYFDTVDQALAQKASLGTSTVRLEGLVVPHSIVNTAVGTDFSIAESGRTIRVDNTGSPPQLFQPNIPVVVVGHFQSPTSALFQSNSILVKHTADYVASYPARVRAPNGTVR
jgi:cytochrome c-type biogenesis protein CcmE